MPIMNPIININGATAKSHIEARIVARQTLREAMEALSHIRPHGRDYLGDVGRYNDDLAIHNERQAMLDKLYNELEMEALAIQEGE